MATQQEIAVYLDLSDNRHVRWLIEKGVLPASKGRGGMDQDACRVAYIRYLRGIKSGQVKEQPFDEEKPSVAAEIEIEKLREIRRKNDIEEGVVAPVDVLTSALHKSANIVIPILESLPLLLKRKWPEITGDQITLVKKAIADCRNAIADSTLDLDE